MNITFGKFIGGFGRLISALMVLPIFLVVLLAGFLMLFAPIPQIIIHVRWCWLELGWIGKLILFSGLFGLMAIVWGVNRKQVKLHRAGMILVVASVIGVALHRTIKSGDWRELSLLLAFLLTFPLIYFVAVLLRDEGKESVK